MNWKQQLLLSVLALWLVFSFVNAVHWQLPNGFVRWEWRSEGLGGSPGSLGKFLLLALPPLILAVPLWSVLGEARGMGVVRFARRLGWGLLGFTVVLIPLGLLCLNAAFVQGVVAGGHPEWNRVEIYSVVEAPGADSPPEIVRAVREARQGLTIFVLVVSSLVGLAVFWKKGVRKSEPKKVS